MTNSGVSTLDRPLTTPDEGGPPPTVRRYNFLGCPIDSYSFDQAIAEIIRRLTRSDSTNLVHFLNVAKIVKAQSDSRLRNALWDGDLVLADGKPLLPTGRPLGINLTTRVNGTDLMESLLAVCEEREFKVYFLGSKPEVIDQFVRSIRKKYVRLQISGYRNGYFSEEETRSVIKEINRTGPDVLLLGLGTPQKELFAFHHRHDLHVSIIQGVGGSFDVLAGSVKRAPRWMQDYGLEWFYRVIQEPRRLSWRYLSTNSRFIFMYAQHLLKCRRSKNH